MAKTRVLPAGSAEKPSLPVSHLFSPVTVSAMFSIQLVIHSCPRARLSFVIDEYNVWSDTTAFASRCAQLTAGPFGPLDNVVNTLGSMLFRRCKEPKYHGYLLVNSSNHFLKSLVVSWYSAPYGAGASIDSG